MDQITWVRTFAGAPPASAFDGTQGLGSPIIIDSTADTPYYIKNGTPTPFAGGGGGGSGTVTTTGTPASGNLTKFSGATSITNGDLSGDVTTSGTLVTTISASAVSLAKMANVATGTVFYRKTAGAGAPEVQLLATLKTDLGLTGTNSGDQTITLTGNVTGTGTGSFATTIAAGAVTNAMHANMPTANFKGRTTAGAGAPEDLTATQATAMLNQFTSLLQGVVPSSGGGTANYLRADGLWAAPPGTNTGTVTSVGGTGTVNGLTLTGTVTTSGNLTLGGTLSLVSPPAIGGTTPAAGSFTNLVSTTLNVVPQPAPTAKTVSVTLTIGELLTLLITSTSASAVTLTVPTGTNCDSGTLSGAMPANTAFDWSVVNLGSSLGAATIASNAGHTLVGNMVVAINTTGRFRSRKTALNTFITYRLS